MKRLIPAALATAISVAVIAGIAGAFTQSEKATITALRDRITVLETSQAETDARLDALEAISTPTPTPAPTATPTLPPPTPTPTPSATPRPAPTPVPPTGISVPASIDSTGATNVTTAMRNFIAGVPNGSTIVFPQGGIYDMASGGIRLQGRQDLTFVGNGSTIKTTGCAYNDAPFLIENSSAGISIDGLTLVGGHTAAGTSNSNGGCTDNASGVTIFASNDITLTHLTFRNVFADCVYVSESTPGRSKRITFTDSTCTLNGRMGVAVVGGEDVTVRRVTFDKIAMHPYDCEPNSAAGGCYRVVFSDNQVGSFMLDDTYSDRFIALNGGDGGAGKLDGFTAENNVLTGGPLIIVSTQPNRSNIVIRNNTSTFPYPNPGSSGSPMYFSGGCTNLTITGNRQPLTSGSLITQTCTGTVNTTGNITQ